MSASTSTATAPAIPGYVVGTWTVDPVHTDVSFVARHMMVSKVRGNFATFSGTITTAENPLESTGEATIDLASLTTGTEQRDNHLRSADFFEVEKYPTMTYRATGLRHDGDDLVVDGELTLKGVTRSVPLALEVNGVGPDTNGQTRLGLSLSADINRKDFGVNFSAAANGVIVVSDKVRLQVEVEAILDEPKA